MVQALREKAQNRAVPRAAKAQIRFSPPHRPPRALSEAAVAPEPAAGTAIGPEQMANLQILRRRIGSALATAPPWARRSPKEGRRAVNTLLRWPSGEDRTGAERETKAATDPSFTPTASFVCAAQTGACKDVEMMMGFVEIISL